MSATDEVLEIFQRRGSCAYFGESVSTTEHCLQAAYFAHAEAAPPALVIAALLHDVGHLVEKVPDDLADWTVDARHEQVGGRWLAQRFGLEVSEPVRLHVPAKRYLCATEPQYLATLSLASLATLNLQGGPMSTRESALFQTERFQLHAIRLRRWDDRAKITGWKTPGIAHYRSLMEELMNRPAASLGT